MRREFDAYMTVEAAFVIPIATFIMAVIIYFSFYMYGRCILAQDVYVLGFRASIFYEQRGYQSPADYVNDKAYLQTANRYFASGEPQINGGQSGKNVTVSGNIKTLSGPGAAYFQGLPARLTYEAQGSARIYDMPGSLRKIRRIKDIAVKITGDKKNGN